jgi:trimeric autotransporter adhesin
MWKLRSLMAVTVCALGLAGVLSAQIRSSAITGTVADTTGAIVGSARVVVTNLDTGISQETKSNEVGEYTVPYLQAGRYAVVAEMGGFQPYRVTDIVLGTATTMRVNVTLTPGVVTTVIEVAASATALQTESSVVQGSVGEAIIATVPNITNNPLYYATLQAGVVGAPQVHQSTRLGVGFQDRQSMSAIRINGGLMGSNDVQLDGLSVQGAAWHETTVVPNRDSLQEVRVITNSFAADMGNAQGAITMTTKSGSNALHGSLSYRARNEGLNANGLRNNKLGIARAKYRVHDGGGSVGGPVVLPKVYDGRNKLFFFGSFWRLKYSEPVQALNTVPTERERNGDFSQTLVADNQGKPVAAQIFDPYSAVPYQGSKDIFIRSPYPGAIIPNPNPLAMKYLKAYPLPNNTPTDPFGSNNHFFQGLKSTVRNNMAGRMDYRLGTRHSLYATGGFQNGSIDQPNRWGADNPFVNMAWPGLTSDNNWYTAVGDTVVFSPTLVMDVRYGVTRINTASSYPAGSGFTYDDYGMPKEVQALVAVWGTAPSTRNFGGAPNRNITNLSRDGWARKNEHQTNHTLTGSITKIVGRWTLKNGGEFRNRLGNWADLLNGTPELMASNHSAQLGGLAGGVSSLVTEPALRGVGLASALTGAMAWSLQSGTTTAPALSAKYFAVFSQNDWRATDKLTLNLGLRYEVQPGPTDRYNHGSSVDLSAPNPFAGSRQFSNPLASMGLLAFPGTAGYSRNLWDTQWNNLGPRLGVVYRLNERTVVRGGYGLTYIPSNTGFNANGLVYGTGPFSGGALQNVYGLAPNGLPVGTFADTQTTIIVTPPGATQAPQIYGNARQPFGGLLPPKPQERRYAPVELLHPAQPRPLVDGIRGVRRIESKRSLLAWISTYRHLPRTGHYSPGVAQCLVQL